MENYYKKLSKDKVRIHTKIHVVLNTDFTDLHELVSKVCHPESVHF